MKLLKALIKQQPENVHNQILGWLYWLKSYCSSRLCASCEFYNKNAGNSRCVIKNTCEDILVPPHKWKLPRGYDVTPRKPPRLEFLKDLYWTGEGNPIPPPKGK